METRIIITRIGSNIKNVSGMLCVTTNDETCDVCDDTIRKGEYCVIIEPCGTFCTGCVDWDD